MSKEDLILFLEDKDIHFDLDTNETLQEFKNRDDENKNKIKDLIEKIAKKDDEIYKINGDINTYKIKEYQYIKAEAEKEKDFKKKYKEILSNGIINEKGNLSKEKIIKIISKLLETK